METISTHKGILFFVLLALVSLATTVFFIYDYYSYNLQQHAFILQKVQQETMRLAQEVESFVTPRINPLKNLGNQIASGFLDHQKLIAELKNLLEKQEDLFSTGVFYLPETETVTEKKDLEGFLFERNDNKIIVINQKYENYKATQWYVKALINQKEGWSEPYKDSSPGQLVRFYFPFFALDKKKSNYFLKGVLTCDFALSTLENIFEKFEHEFGAYSCLFLEEEEGPILYHPVKMYTDSLHTIQDAAKEPGKENRSALLEHLKTEQNGYIEGFNKIHDFNEIITYYHLTNLGWNVSVVYQSYEGTQLSPLIRHKLIHMAMSCAFFLLLLFFLLNLYFIHRQIISWVLVFLSSFIFIMLIGLLWVLDDLKDQRFALGKGTTIETHEQSVRFLKMIARQHEGNFSLRDQVLTGIFIESFQISKDNLISIEGYWWYQYDKNTGEKFPKDKPLGFFVGAHSSSFNKIYQVQQGNKEKIGWKFNVTLYGDFHFDRYPHDHQIVSLWLRSSSLIDPIIFSPDFEAWENVDANVRKELLDEQHTIGWGAKKFYNSYLLTHFRTTLGITNSIFQKNFPEFSVHMVLRRDYINIMLGILIPIMLTLLMLFVTMIVNSLKERFSLISLISFTGASLLATIIPHATLRSAFPFNVPYAEYFFFITYLFTILVLINNILLSSGSRLFLIAYRNNLLPKLFFWPTVTALFFIVTLFHFY